MLAQGVQLPNFPNCVYVSAIVDRNLLRQGGGYCTRESAWAGFGSFTPQYATDLASPKLLPHRVNTVGIFCGLRTAARSRILYYTTLSKICQAKFATFSKKYFSFFSKNRLTKSIACSIIKVRKAKESKTNGKSNLF
jgi:hypothetical protein